MSFRERICVFGTSGFRGFDLASRFQEFIPKEERERRTENEENKRGGVRKERKSEKIVKGAQTMKCKL